MKGGDIEINGKGHERIKKILDGKITNPVYLSSEAITETNAIRALCERLSELQK